MSSNIKQTLKIVIVALILSVGVSYLFAAWTPPPSNPPNSNTDAPINVGGISQTKIGDICTTFGGSQKCLSQAGAALNAGGFGNFLVFDYSTSKYSSGTLYANSANGQYAWTVPAGVTKIMIEAWGAGGGGGSSDNANQNGGAGGGGGYGKGIYTVTTGASLVVIVGKGGKGADTTPTTSGGSAGGTSSVGSLISATGGGGGAPFYGCVACVVGGSSTAPINVVGGYAIVNLVPGGGGSGGFITTPSLDGRPGRVVVWW